MPALAHRRAERLRLPWVTHMLLLMSLLAHAQPQSCHCNLVGVTTSLQRYNSWCLQREDYPRSYDDWYFILFTKCTNCGIEGEGRVDGQGSLWVYSGYVPYANMPFCTTSLR